MSRRVRFLWHSWIGLTTGLMLFVICFSGSIAVFSYEIDWLLNPALRARTVAGDVPFAEAYAAVERARPGWKVLEVNAPRHDGFAMEVLAEATAETTQRVYVDPVTLQVLGDTSYFNVQRFFRSFHMALFQPAYVSILGIPLGYFIVLLFAFPLFVSLVTALTFYKRWWRGFFGLVTRKGPKAFWSSFHKLSGVWAIWFTAIICLTSFWYLAEWFMPYPPAPTPPAGVEKASLPVATLLEMGRSAFPELKVTGIRLDDFVVYIAGDDGTTLTRGSAYAALDTRNGQILQIYHQGKSGLTARLLETVDVLHFGTFGGLWSQALYFVFGLMMSALCLTGAYLHASRPQEGLRRARPEILSAYAVTALCLIIATVAGVQEIKSYGVDGAWPHMGLPALIFIAAWCALTLGALTLWACKVR